MEATNPATNERIDTYEEDTPGNVETTISRATAAFEEWQETPLRERQELLANAGDVLRNRKRELGELMGRVAESFRIGTIPVGKKP